MTPTTFKLKQELYSIIHAALGCTILALVLAGIGGTIYKVIAPEGWIALAFGRSLSAGAAALGSIWGDPVKRTRISDLLVYGFAFAGVVYLAQFWTKGTF